MLFVAITALVAAVVIVVLYIETTALAVEHVELPLTGLPSRFEGFRIVQISDLHGRHFATEGREWRAIQAAQPDIIVVTGDFVHRRAAEIDRVMPFLRALINLAPVYAVSGNHDHRVGWSYIAATLRAAGVVVLDNAHVRLVRGEQEIVLAGVNNPLTGHGSLVRALPPEAGATTILLAHSPFWFEPWNVERAPRRLPEIALTLVGHTHGGQAKLPFFGAVTTASGRLFPRRNIEGLSWVGQGWLYINRGLGHPSWAFRFLSRREITVLKLRQSSS